jgi:hypothetical protein
VVNPTCPRWPEMAWMLYKPSSNGIFIYIYIIYIILYVYGISWIPQNMTQMSLTYPNWWQPWQPCTRCLCSGLVETRRRHPGGCGYGNHGRGI